MKDTSALQEALALFRTPTRVKRTRKLPLPVDIAALLRIVSSDEQAIEEATRATGRSREFLVSAATFYAEQILLAPNADSYRVLGCSADASREVLRANMVMLLKWLHPDTLPDENRRGQAVRVTRAWNNLKTMDRRAAYDQSRRGSFHADRTATPAQQPEGAMRAQSPRKARRDAKPTLMNSSRPKHHATRRRSTLFSLILSWFLPSIRRI